MSYGNSSGYSHPRAIVIKKAPRIVVGRHYDNETPFSALFNSIYDGAIITDDEGWVMDVNVQAQQMFDYTKDELCELNITNLIAGTNDELVDMICRNIDREKHTLMEGKCVRGDRSSFRAEIAVGIERLPPSNGPCFFIRDITQRKQAENYLLTLKHAFENAANGIVVTDLDGIILYANPRFSELLGCDPHVEVTGHHLHSIFSDTSLIQNMFKHIAEVGKYAETISAEDTDGTHMHLKITGSPNRDQVGETTTGMVFIVEDITQQKQIALMKEQATLQKLDAAETKARLETMTTLGYEFNNPLQSLLSMAEKDKLPEYRKEISRLIDIVQQLHQNKDLHKIIDEDGRVRYSLTPPEEGYTACTPRTILIAEDEKLIRDIFVQFLELSFENIKVDYAADGQEALEKFFTDHHSLIIMDSMMPIVNGEKAYDEIAAYCELNNWQMPHIIFCTGFVPTEKITGIIGNGGQHALLPKPVRQAELVEVVDKFL
jgi:PAS domain S-box-containing protein